MRIVYDTELRMRLSGWRQVIIHLSLIINYSSIVLLTCSDLFLVKGCNKLLLVNFSNDRFSRNLQFTYFEHSVTVFAETRIKTSSLCATDQLPNQHECFSTNIFRT